MKLFIAIPRITPPETLEAMRKAAEIVGFTPVFAADVTPRNLNSTPNVNLWARFHAVRKAMQPCDAILANLTPFLSVEPDPEVTFQLGYMAAQQKSVFAFSNSAKPFYDRVEEWNGQGFETQLETDGSDHVARILRDRNQLRVEAMGVTDPSPYLVDEAPDQFTHFALEGPITRTGSIVFTPSSVRTHVPETSLYSDLSVFAAALAEARQHLLVEGRAAMRSLPASTEDPNAFYLAGPDALLPEPRPHFDEKKLVLSDCGLRGVSPLDSTLDVGLMQSWARSNGNNPRMRQALYDLHIRALESARGGVFNLTPHRGVFADSGAVFDMGYMLGRDDRRGRQPMLFGYSNESQPLLARVRNWAKHPQGPSYGVEETVGAFRADMVFSEMIDGAILASGGSLANRLGHNKAAYLNLQDEYVFAHLSEFIHAVYETKQASRILDLAPQAEA